MSRNISRAASMFAILWIYVFALFTACLCYRLFDGQPALLRAFLADIAATLVVWFSGVLLGNSSVYDPYWSVAPVVLAAWWMIAVGSLTLPGMLFLAAILCWGARLTVNWARRFEGLARQDWRYTMYKQSMPRLWPAVNLFGIHLMPTVLVFLGMIPVYEGMRRGAVINCLTASGFLLCVLAVALEHAADRRMDAYRSRPQPKSPTLGEGVWLWCRHPNYLGEVLFWWGIWVMQMSLAPLPWTAIGPLLITLLFVFISIPMMEKHVLETRPEYAQYIKKVPRLLPLPRFHS